VLTRDLVVGADAAQFELVVPFETVSVHLAVGLRGALTWTGEFALPTAQVELVGDAMELLLANDGAAEVDVVAADETTTYTVRLDGAGPAELTSAYNAWTGGTNAAYAVHDLEGANLVSESYEIAAVLPLDVLLGRHVEGVRVAYTVSVPFGQAFEADTTVPELVAETAAPPAGLVVDGNDATFTTGPDGVFHLRAGGTSIVGFALYAALGLLLLTAVLVLVLHRKRIVAAVTGRSARAAKPDATVEVASAGLVGQPDAGQPDVAAGRVLPAPRPSHDAPVLAARTPGPVDDEPEHH